MLYKTQYDSSLGVITLIADGQSLIGLQIGEQKTHSEDVEEKGDLAIFGVVKYWLDDYFAGRKPLINDLTLVLRGSAFRQNVWSFLQKIPYGKVITYGDVAKQIAVQKGVEKMSAQAVGGAVGHNPIAIIIPCHRVIGAKGNLTGYAGGLDIKMRLLEHEGIDVSKFFVPKYKKYDETD